MLDPLGLSKETGNAGSPEKPAAGFFASPKLWAILLIVDSLFVVVFGGALANNFYQHWSEPAIAAKTPPPAKPKPAPEPVKPPEEEPAKPPEPPKAPVAAAQPKTDQQPAAKSPPPKPSLVQSAPKPRETPKPQQPGQTPKTEMVKAAPAAAAPSVEKVKALPVEFSLNSPKAKKVQLAGAFIVRGGKKDMTRGADGTWTITVYLTPGTYRYTFLVNGMKSIDPKNSKIDRGASVISVP